MTTGIKLLDEVLDAHGGLDRWKKYSGLASSIVTGGRLWPLKGVDLGDKPRRVKTEFTRQWMQVSPFGQPDWTMTWTPQYLKVTDASGNLIGERDDPRNAFDRGYEAPWDPLNLAYFNGYAMWTYHAGPFIFAEPGYEVQEIDTIMHEGERLRGLAVTFPEHIHSHTRRQRFYFTDDGLLRRHDYEVDVWADTRASHFTWDHVDVNGLKFPTRRSVFARNADGTLNFDFNTVTIALSEFELF